MLKNVIIATLVLVAIFFTFSVFNSYQEYSDSTPPKSDDSTSSTIVDYLGSKETVIDIVSTEFDDIYDKYGYFAQKKNQIIKEFSRIDSLQLWDKQGKIIDPDSTWSTPEGSGWDYYINDSLEYYVYGEFAESHCWLYYYYIRNGELLMFRDVNTKYNAPLGYEKEVAFAKGDSTEYRGQEDFEELSIFKDNKIIYQLSPDCGTPNSSEYVRLVQDKIVKDLEIIRELVKQQD